MYSGLAQARPELLAMRMPRTVGQKRLLGLAMSNLEILPVFPERMTPVGINV